MLTGTRNETYSFGEFVKKDRDGERREAEASLRSCFLMSTVYFNLLTSERSGCIGAMTIMKTYFVLKRKFVKTT